METDFEDMAGCTLSLSPVDIIFIVGVGISWVRRAVSGELFDLGASS